MEARMVVLRFPSDEVRQACCDLARMRRLWGPIVARRISRRLQQLEAITTLADLGFLPFDSYEHDDGVFEVAVTDRLALFIERGPDSSEGEALMDTIVITALRDRQTVARTS
jgi:hypothetical protein